MRNPWLDIPLADYEGHMSLPHVGQAVLLGDVFEGALREGRVPRSPFGKEFSVQTFRHAEPREVTR